MNFLKNTLHLEYFICFILLLKTKKTVEFDVHNIPYTCDQNNAHEGVKPKVF